MKNHKLLVSIIVPCYNQGEYLFDALNSIWKQTCEYWECIIVNDGSTDNTKEIALEFCEKDPRFIYLEQKNRGLSSARNNGVINSKGEYILPLDSDDKIAPTYISKALRCFEEDDSLKIVYCRAAFFGKRFGEWTLPTYSLEKMLGQNCIFCSALYKRIDFDFVGGYKSNMKYGYEDWDFWLSILENGGNVYKIDEILFFYRIRKKSMARSLDIEKIKYLRHQIWENHRELYANNFLDITNTFEYNLIANSLEYKIGKLFVKPLRWIYNILYR